MMDSRKLQPSVALFGGLKTVALLLCAVWGLSRFFAFQGGGPRISASGEYSPLYFPESYKMELVDVKGQRREMKSLWRFDFRNEGAVEARNLVFELPFSGFYRVKAGNGPASRVANFEKTIPIETLDPTQPVSILVWTDSAADAEFEKDTRINVEGTLVPVEYPVKVEGLLAWIERHKLLISILIFVAVIAVLL